MTDVVKDWRGNQIEVGTPVMYGAPDTEEERRSNKATVTAISEPDADYDDELGRGVYYGSKITIRFDASGDEETISSRVLEVWGSGDTVCEAHDDIEVIQ